MLLAIGIVILFFVGLFIGMYIEKKQWGYISEGFGLFVFGWGMICLSLLMMAGGR